MKPTKSDLLTSFAGVGIFALTVGLSLNPIGRLEVHRDEERVHGVRTIHAAVAQLEATDAGKYLDLISRLELEEGKKMVIGEDVDCGGYWGGQCQSAGTADSCLRLQEFVPESLLPAIPISPGDDFSQQVTGYYLELVDSEIAVGACNPSGGKIVLPAD